MLRHYTCPLALLALCDLLMALDIGKGRPHGRTLSAASAAEMEPDQQILVRLASLEGRVLDIRAVVALLLAGRPPSPACFEIPLPAFVRCATDPLPIPTLAMQASCRRSFWL